MIGNGEAPDLSALGIECSHCLLGGDASYRAFQHTCLRLLEGLGPEIHQVRLYTFDARGEIFREEAVADRDGLQEGSDLLPAFQLPEALVLGGEVLLRNLGTQCELLLPLRAPKGPAGLVAIVSSRPFPEPLLPALHRIALPLALAVQYATRARQSERAYFLLRTVTRIGRELHAVTEAPALLEIFVATAIEYLGFDRATLFVFDEDGETVRRSVHGSSGHQVSELATPPVLPSLGRRPVALESIPGLWIPMVMGTRRLGVLWVDNIYSLEPPAEDAVQALSDLGGQVALALENIRLFGRLREAALRDDLTGLFRLGYFTERVHEELATARRHESLVGLIMLDVDRFKTVNDTYGHPVGDAALVHVSDRIRGTLRAGDIACRKGGDEFMILVPGMTPESGSALSARLLHELAENPLPLPDGGTLPISTSIGMAIFPDHAMGWEELWQRADQALYISKQCGRGRYSLFSAEAAAA